MTYELKHFIDAQDFIYDFVIEELNNSKKRTCWMWFVFPQIQGLGISPTTKKFALLDLDHAKQYLKDEILGTRLIECSKILLSLKTNNAYDIFKDVDVLKLQSSMTLFALISPENSIFHQVLDKFFNGKYDENTLDILK